MIDSLDILGETGERLADGTDINNLTTPGKYYSASSTTTGTMENVPATGSGFTVFVFRIGSAMLCQLAFRTANTASGMFFRVYVNNSWGSSWYRLTAEAV